MPHKKLEVVVSLGGAQEMFGIADTKIYRRRIDEKCCLGATESRSMGVPMLGDGRAWQPGPVPLLEKMNKKHPNNLETHGYKYGRSIHPVRHFSDS